MAFASPNAPLLRGYVLQISCVVFASISCFGATAFHTVSSTPYDRQMNRVFAVLNSGNMQQPESLSLMAVSHLMMQLRNMPYEYSSRWQTPGEVDLTQTADCKGKAVALYAQMRKSGAKNVRVVIGRRHIFDSGTHAWLEWQAKEGSFVLDPTFNDMPTRTAEISPATYVALYAYDGAHKYCASNTGFVAPPTRVATGTYVPARTTSISARPVLAAVPSRPTVPPTPARTLATQGSQLNAQRAVTVATQHSQLNASTTVSVARRTLPTAEKVRPSKVVVSSSKTKSVISTHRKVAVTQKGHGRRRRHIASRSARSRHVRSPVISQNESYVIPVQPTRLPPQL